MQYIHSEAECLSADGFVTVRYESGTNFFRKYLSKVIITLITF